MANPQRGEVELLAGEMRLTLCLTLGGLAEIEALNRDGEALTAETLLRLVEILARGGGSAITLETLKAAPLSLTQAADAVAACLAAGMEP
ncbi:hypothetical protein AWH62_10615 [Maricaulis sp. W15]|uniref:hypothetical protein n=1 Tax=Maricaulis sp. W15 TaxID=1772333 RepID=UPI00094916FD|nr:hypothetical protein [Maricaulis sp. W15]OLF72281.1 hypothetical protein AWH62_10615 [Maricaulis sp. W15]